MSSIKKCLHCRGAVNMGIVFDGTWTVHTINDEVLAHWTPPYGVGGEWIGTACGLKVWVELEDVGSRKWLDDEGMLLPGA